MTLTMPVPTNPGSLLFPLTPLWFARRTDRELDDDDFDDDESDDFDDFRSKRPRRRSFFMFALLLLLIVGVWYIATDSDVRSIITRVTTTISATLNPGAEVPSRQPSNDKNSVPSSQAMLTSVFHEGQRVAVMLSGNSHARLPLSHDAEGTQHGPSVKTGDVLTIIDGKPVKDQWVYIVQTQSGASGWIQEEYLRAYFPDDGQFQNKQRQLP